MYVSMLTIRDSEMRADMFGFNSSDASSKTNVTHSKASWFVIPTLLMVLPVVVVLVVVVVFDKNLL